MTKIIGFTGPAGSGKDTACEFALEWCEENGVNAERLAFADPLKVSAARALGFDGDAEQCVAFCNNLKRDGVKVVVQPSPQPLLYAGEPYTLSGRQFLQFYGTEAHRDVFGKEFWVELTEQKLRASTADVVFLTDPRFKNEQTMIYRNGGELWHVVRPDVVPVAAHASEAGLKHNPGDAVITNDTTLDDLRDEVRSLCGIRLEAEE